MAGEGVSAVGSVAGRGVSRSGERGRVPWRGAAGVSVADVGPRACVRGVWAGRGRVGASLIDLFCLYILIISYRKFLNCRNLILFSKNWDLVFISRTRRVSLVIL